MVINRIIRFVNEKKRMIRNKSIKDKINTLIEFKRRHFFLLYIKKIHRKIMEHSKSV